MPGKPKIEKLAALVETLKVIPAELVTEAAPLINEQIRKMGRPGGPLRNGNAVRCEVYADRGGLKIRVIGVFPNAGVRRSWLRGVERIIGELLKKQLNKW